MRNQLKNILGYFSRILAEQLDQTLKVANQNLITLYHELSQQNKSILGILEELNREKFHETKKEIILNYQIEGKHPSLLVVGDNGNRVFLDPRDPHITIHFLQSKSWEPHIAKYMHEIYSVYAISGTASEDVYTEAIFIDCGANVGLHSMNAYQIGYKVFAFEPDPLTFKFLELNAVINGMQFNPKQVAVSDFHGTLDFAIDNHSSGMSGLSKSESGTGRLVNLDIEENRYSHIQVQSVKLDDEFRKLFSDKPLKLVFLKVDTEGSEGDVISGAFELLRSVSTYVVICEMHLDNKILIQQLQKLIEIEINEGNIVELQLLRFERPPVTLDPRVTSSWHDFGVGDLALKVVKS